MTGGYELHNAPLDSKVHIYQRRKYSKLKKKRDSGSEEEHGIQTNVTLTVQISSRESSSITYEIQLVLKINY